MSRLPTLKPKEVLAALQRAGFDIVRVRGSHYQLLNPITKCRVTVPHHTRDLTKATLSSILNQAGLSIDDFRSLL
jgi:predicted RNA binding protein YcfA (HicA-like mRNA interferase family)